MILKRWVRTSAILATTLLILATSSTTAHSDDSGEYLFILKGRGNIFWKVIRQGVEETAQARGIHAVILNTDDDQTPEAQLNMCLASLARKPKVLVLGAATRNVGIECFRRAAADGVPAADIDGNVTTLEAKGAGVPLAFSVGSDNTLIGTSAANYLASIEQKQNPSILVLKGLPGSIVSEKRANGFLEQIKLRLPAARIVGVATTDWDRMKSMNIAADYLQREPTLDYVFSASDIMSMGVIEALRIADKAAQVKVISVDGIADARKAIVEGRMAASVAQLPYLMGKKAVELAIEAAAGHPSGKDEFIPIPVLSKQVLEKPEDPILEYLR